MLDISPLDGIRSPFGRRRGGGATAFSPSTLFALAEPGVWFDPSDLSTLFQDPAGTTPVTTPGQTVARMNDKSGRGNHATQATLASRPTYGVDGSGNAYLAFDGVDDSMATTVDTNTIFGVTGADPGYLLVGGAKYNTAGGATSPWVRLAFCGDSLGYFGMWAHTVNGGEAGLYHWNPTIVTPERPYAVGSAAVFTGRRDPSIGASGSIYASVNGVSSAAGGAVALTSSAGTFLVGRQFGNTFLNGNIYSLIARGALTDAPTIASTETWVAGKTGIVI